MAGGDETPPCSLIFLEFYYCACFLAGDLPELDDFLRFGTPQGKLGAVWHLALSRCSPELHHHWQFVQTIMVNICFHFHPNSSAHQLREAGFTPS